MKILFLTLALVLESICLLFIFLSAPFSTPYGLWCLLFHFVSCLFLAPLLVPLFFNCHQNKVTSYLFVLFTSFSIPLFGPVLVLSFYLVEYFFHKKIKSKQQYHFSEAQKINSIESPYQNTETALEKSVLQQLHSTSEKDRRNAVLSLETLSLENISELLNKAVRDSDEYVRSYAQSLIKKISEREETHLKQIKNHLEETPNATHLIMMLAEQHYHMLNLGLISHESISSTFQKIISLLEKVFSFYPKHSEAHYLALLCHLHLQEASQAKKHWRILRSLNYKNRSLRMIYLEILFLEKKWEAFHKHLRLLQRKGSSEQASELFEFWRTSSQSPSLEKSISPKESTPIPI